MNIFGIFAAAEPAGQGSIWSSMAMLLLFGVIFYFMLIRPQQKRHKEHKAMVEAVEKGDEVITNGGIVGKVTDKKEGFVVLSVADNVEITIQQAAIGSTLPKGTIKTLK